MDSREYLSDNLDDLRLFPGVNLSDDDPPSALLQTVAEESRLDSNRDNQDPPSVPIDAEDTLSDSDRDNRNDLFQPGQASVFPCHQRRRIARKCRSVSSRSSAIPPLSFGSDSGGPCTLFQPVSYPLRMGQPHYLNHPKPLLFSAWRERAVEADAQQSIEEDKETDVDVTQPSRLLGMPEDVLMRIVEMLDSPSVAALKFTCWKMYMFVLRNGVWRKVAVLAAKRKKENSRQL